MPNTPRMTPERIAEIRALYAFDPRHVVNEIFAEIDAVTRERDEKLASTVKRAINGWEGMPLDSELYAPRFERALRAARSSDSAASNEGAKQEEPCDCDRGWRGNLVLGTLRRCENGCPDA